MTRQYSSPTPPARTWPRAASAGGAASFKSGCGKWDHPFEASRFRRTRVDGTTPKALCPKLAPVGLNPALAGQARGLQAVDRSPGQRSVMPHIDTPQVKQHILADVGSVVGDPIQVADYEEQVDSRR